MFFTQKVVGSWNTSPWVMMEAGTIGAFKRHLDSAAVTQRIRQHVWRTWKNNISGRDSSSDCETGRHLVTWGMVEHESRADGGD